MQYRCKHANVSELMTIGATEDSSFMRHIVVLMTWVFIIQNSQSLFKFHGTMVNNCQLSGIENVGSSSFRRINTAGSIAVHATCCTDDLQKEPTTTIANHCS